MTGLGEYDSSIVHYKGQFIDGKFNGEGSKFVKANSRTYTGLFRNNKFIKGSCTFSSDNSRYEGEFLNE